MTGRSRALSQTSSFSKQLLRKVSIPTAMCLLKRESTICSGQFSESSSNLESMTTRWWFLPRGRCVMNSCRILTSSPTFFDPVKATKPDSYQIDSQSLISLFKNGQVKNWQNHFYLEMGVARATVTKD